MAQRLIQTQQQKLEQQQQLRLTQQQMLTLHLLEMPLARLEEEIEAVMDDNPALERDYENEVTYDNVNENENDNQYDDDNVNEDYQDELSRALDDMSRDDDMESFDDGQSTFGGGQMNDDIMNSGSSFYESLIEQMHETTLTDEQHIIMEYLIGSLDTDGMLRKELDIISDELAIYHYIDVSTEEIEQTLRMLQQFEPAGIGARSLQECLMLQIERMSENSQREEMMTIIRDHYDAFMSKHWERIQTAMHLTDDHTATLMQALRRLNPKPGAAMGEATGISRDQITPDIIIEQDEDGHITFSINHGNMPQLKVADDYLDEMKHYDDIDDKQMTRSEREAKSYYKEKIEKANWYVEAIRQRYKTMTLCTRVILQWQKRYFVDGDEAELRPMILRDIADKTGLDISTVSRFSNQKYAETPWGIRPMRFFFSDGYTNSDGEEMATRTLKIKLREIIEAEDKKHPLSDEALAQSMAKAGYPIARRTITKYREQMNIPVARLRK